jgi:cysteine desulfurase
MEGPFANPNAIHSLGGKIFKGLEQCRTLCAQNLGAKSSQVLFNSGSSEGITHIFWSLLSEKKPGKNIIVLSKIEHSAVQNAAAYYETQGYELYFVPCLKTGVIDLATLKSFLAESHSKVAMVSLMAANNETGAIQPFQEIGQLAQSYQVPFFSDTTQLVGKIPFDFASAGMDFAVVSGHKLGALTGTGLILVKNPRALLPLIFGGGQENGKRGGTQNYLGIETLTVALEDTKNKFDLLDEKKEWQIEFETKLKKEFPELVIFSDSTPRLPGTTFLSYPGIHGQALQIELESQDIFVTTSSACSDNDPTPSKVLKAMLVEDHIGRGAVRISLGWNKLGDRYSLILEALIKAIHKLKKISI